jgi:hypothetical protein
MYPSRTPLLLIPLICFCLCACGHAFYTVTLTNADITDFSAGLAVDWTSFTTGTTLPPALQFFADPSNYRTPPYAQGISGIDTLMAAGSRFGAGIFRRLAVTPGDVYMFVGYQDLYDPYFAPPAARRYCHFFGLDPLGGSAPPQPFTMGDVRWMGQDQWFYNEMAGNSTQIGGMHRCMAAFPAVGDHISLWSGVYVYGDAPTSAHQVNMDIDAHTLYGFANPLQTTLQNAGFETVDNLTPTLTSDDVQRITLPASWVPIGGGIGQKESYYTDSAAKRSGSAGVRIYNQRGCLTRGLMQRVQTPSASTSATFSVWVRANRSAGAIARVGIDPTGGTDINSSSVIWSYYNRSDEAWEQESVTAGPVGPAITVFISMYSYDGATASTHYADFDDAALSVLQDVTPPEPFAVVSQSPWPLTTYLGATITPAPSDPESGIALVEYAIGATPGGQQVSAFAACPNPARVTAYGLSLTPGATYYITVRATNGVGLTTTASSGPILCTAEHAGLDAHEVTVTGTFKHLVKAGSTNVWKSVPFCSIQDDNGLDAVRVVTGNAQDSPVPPDSIKPGDLVTATGSYTTIDGQLTLGALTDEGTAVDVTVNKVGVASNPARPRTMSVRNLGGITVGNKTGVTGGLGPNNVGMLVSVCGRVQAVSTDDRGLKVLYIDDGSNVPCGVWKGCKVYAAGFDAVVGDCVIATGVSGVEIYDPTPAVPGDETRIRVLIPRDIRHVQ